ncbi:MAG TPA: pilus assembly protein TadG-related protein [Tepidisphaeraceae bacterium]
MVLIYASIVLVALLALASLAVDWGQVQLGKTQAQNAADAAALYAANGILTGTPAEARAQAISAAGQNRVDNAAVVLTASDIEFGIWDPVGRVFQTLDPASESAATAVRVTVRRSASRNNAVRLTFGGAIGKPTINVTASAIATVGRVTGADVPALACPWLAGMPSGSIVPKAGWNNQNTVAPDSSPTSFPITAGRTYRFAQTSGTTSWSGGGSWTNAGTGSAGAEGDTTTVITQDACNGINTTIAPLNGMMGVFLNNTQPTASAMAGALDYTTPASRDAANYAPALKQVFFIGDGLSSSVRLQTFKAPAGATRLYIGVMDAKGWWWDNVGVIKFTAIEGVSAVLVR